MNSPRIVAGRVSGLVSSLSLVSGLVSGLLCLPLLAAPAVLAGKEPDAKAAITSAARATAAAPVTSNGSSGAHGGAAGTGAAPITRLEDAPAAGSGEPVRFTAEAKWQIAGYNDQEIVYTIIITSQDTRVIHCSAELHGFYFDNGTKHSISDRQGTTIFPGKQANVGHWLGMDQQSGATYKVSCRVM